jgi:glutathione S-transferase
LTRFPQIGSVCPSGQFFAEKTLRLREAAHLGSADWLDGAFSAGDLMMVSVLLRLKPSGLLDGYSDLSAYVGRGEARPAYQRAFDAQLAVFTAASSG